MSKNKEKKEGRIKTFFSEFKKFITRGNVLDMAVGVIVGGAFTAIVNGLSNFILKPLINWLIAVLLGKDGLKGAITMLSPSYDEAGAVVLADSIYIDWGSFISAIINFFLIAFVLFSIVRIINRVRETSDRIEQGLESEKNEKKAIAKIKKEQKIGWFEAKAIYQKQVEEKQALKKEEERIAQEKAEAEAKAKAMEEEMKATQNTRLLEEIRDLLKNK